MFEVKIDGVRLGSLANVADEKWSTRWGTGPCGPELASCTVKIDPANDSPLLRLGRRFEILDRGVKVFGGPIDDVSREYPRTISAKGWAKRAADFLAVDSSGNPTTNPRTAVTQAIADGLEWSDPDVFPDASLGDNGGPTFHTLEDLLTQYATSTGMRWGTDADGYAFWEADPTTPSLWLNASDLPIGIAADGLYTGVKARYVSSLDVDGNPNGWTTVTVDDAAAQDEFGVRYFPMPLDSLGYLTGGGTTATDYATQQLALFTVPKWTAAVQTNSGRLRTEGGHGAYLPSVNALGTMVRLTNVPAGLGGLRTELALDYVLGRVEYEANESRVLTIEPLELAVRSIVAQAEQMARLAKKAA